MKRSFAEYFGVAPTTCIGSAITWEDPFVFIFDESAVAANYPHEVALEAAEAMVDHQLRTAVGGRLQDTVCARMHEEFAKKHIAALRFSERQVWAARVPCPRTGGDEHLRNAIAILAERMARVVATVGDWVTQNQHLIVNALKVAAGIGTVGIALVALGTMTSGPSAICTKRKTNRRSGPNSTPPSAKPARPTRPTGPCQTGRPFLRT